MHFRTLPIRAKKRIALVAHDSRKDDLLAWAKYDSHLCSIPAATNRASADFMLSSALMREDYDRIVPDYDVHQRERERRLEEEVADEGI